MGASTSSTRCSGLPDPTRRDEAPLPGAVTIHEYVFVPSNLGGKLGL